MYDKPKHTITIGDLTVSIWKNIGKKDRRFLIVAQRKLKIRNRWCKSLGFHNSHLPQLIEALTSAQHWCTAQEATSTK